MRPLGMTVAELGMIFFGIIGFLFMNAFSLKIAFLCLPIVGIIGVRKVKSMTRGFSFWSFLHWHTGLRYRLPKVFPHSAIRFYLP